MNKPGMDGRVTVIGAGLAGCEAAWQLARRGVGVRLVEMKPDKMTPAHQSPDLAELVCSNSLRSDRLENAVGLLKQELRILSSLIMECADSTRVQAGGALAVDRGAFSALVTEKIKGCPLIELEHGELDEIPDSGRVIVATGPLTSDRLAEGIGKFFGAERYLSFYDAAAPMVAFDSIDMDSAFYASRYGRGTPDYINCPLTKDEYLRFWSELKIAEEAPVHGFEDKKVFEGCMPVEVMARRGEDTLRYGPMKPVGLADPRGGKEPYAVVQLRRDNAEGSVYNLVGFQTHLRHGEQKRVFSMIPALKDARFERYGVMHRNTYIDSPRLLDSRFRAKADPRVAFAGQLTGVEGYVESAASGWYAAVCMAAELTGEGFSEIPPETAVGALARYISDESVKDFQPMNINFGIMPPLGYKVRGKQAKNLELSKRSLSLINDWISEVQK